MTSNEKFVIDRWKQKFGHRFECMKCWFALGYGRKAVAKKLGITERMATTLAKRYRNPDTQRRGPLNIGEVRRDIIPPWPIKHPIIIRQVEWDTIMDDREIEIRELKKYDDCNHWALQSGQLEYARWYARAKEKRHKDTKTNYHIAKLIRSRIHHVIFMHKKAAPTQKLLGCSWQQFRMHIQSQFTRGMNWDNHGRWHLDHIVPCSSFDLSQHDQQRKCFHYSNMRPLWEHENRVKKDNIVECQPELLISITP